MPRQPNKHTTPITLIDPATQPTVDSTALDTVQADAEKVRKFYNITSTEPEVLVNEIMGFQRNFVEAALQAGARLIYLKKITLSGEWAQYLESMSLSHSSCRKLMAFTRFYADPDQPGSWKTPLLNQFNKTQLEALMVLPEDTIEELNDDAAANGDTAKYLAGKTIKQLQETVLELAQRTESLQTLVKTKNDKIDDLDTKLRDARKFKPNPGSEARSAEDQAHLGEIKSCVDGVEVEFVRLSVVVSDVMQQSSNEAVRGRALQAIQYLVKRMTETVSEHGFDIEFEMPGETPPWLKD